MVLIVLTYSTPCFLALPVLPSPLLCTLSSQGHEGGRQRLAADASRYRALKTHPLLAPPLSTPFRSRPTLSFTLWPYRASFAPRSTPLRVCPSLFRLAEAHACFLLPPPDFKGRKSTVRETEKEGRGKIVAKGRPKGATRGEKGEKVASTSDIRAHIAGATVLARTLSRSIVCQRAKGKDR